jgi:hypothetical protein
MNGVPVLYRKLLEYLQQSIEEERLDTREFYKLLSYFRIDRQTAWEIMKELREMGVVEYRKPNRVKINKRLFGGISLFRLEQTYTYRVVSWLGKFVLNSVAIGYKRRLSAQTGCVDI